MKDKNISLTQLNNNRQFLMSMTVVEDKLLSMKSANGGRIDNIISLLYIRPRIFFTCLGQ